MMMVNPNDADDSDSSSDSSPSPPASRSRRSATASPSTHKSVKNFRRRSDVNLHLYHERERQRERRRSMVRASRERSESRWMNEQKLRKTNSEPNVDLPPFDVEALHHLLLTLPKLAAAASRTQLQSTQNQHQHDSDSGGEMTTEIEELKDAAKSIQSLQRVLAYPSQHSSDRGVFSDADDTSTDISDGRRSGISTRHGHPRGVMQFIPSIRNEQFAGSSGSDQALRRTSIVRKSSVPDSFMNVTDADISSEPSMPNIRNRRRGIVDEMFNSSTSLLVDRPSEAMAGVNRLNKLFDSFRSRASSPDQHPTISWSPYVYSDAGESLDNCGMEDSLHEADILLWKKRSRASLRRHFSVRQLAARELLDTEKSFVEGLEFLVTKYMRPLRQPLECTLIEASLVDKIFYRVPEILAHHQVLLAALTQRLEHWHKDTIIGDVLLAHFSKQSMIETFIAFVDNFKYAKAAIVQARQKHAFEKYYNRCCRDHPNKLDLDALLISPIQRVPRYELIVKQMLKHTPVEHDDKDRLIRAQRHIHCLAVAINQHKEGSEQMEQRLREIEAIVDGLDDLVAADRTLLRHDMVTLKGAKRRERCIFMLSDQLLVTSVKKKAKVSSSKMTTQSMDFLDNNKFKLIMNIALDDVQITKDTLTQLEEVQRCLENAKEDDRVLKKMAQLCSLLKCDKERLSSLIDSMETTQAMKTRELSEKMSSDTDLSTIYLQVRTVNGLESLALEFPNAEKRSVWESAFKESKAMLEKHQMTSPSCQLKSILAHQTRSGLQLCTAAVVPGKRADSPPYVWVCACDKFSGQIAVMSLESGEASIESCSPIGNAAVTAMCSVPPPTKTRKRKMKPQRSSDNFPKETSNSSLMFSSGSDSESSSDDAPTSSNAHTTVWIGNDDGEVFVVNSMERVRSRARERLARLGNSVTSICATSNNLVFVATAFDASRVQLLMFRANLDGTWDLDNPTNIQHTCMAPIGAMVVVGKRLILASGCRLHALNIDTCIWQTPSVVLATTDIITMMSSAGAHLFLTGRKSTFVYAVDVFSLAVVNQFNVAPFVRSQLAGREDILREHKMGCLRVSCLTVTRSHLWIGTSAGFVLSTPVQLAATENNPDLNVCDVGHSGPCRILIPVDPPTRKSKRSSLNSPAYQSSQMLIASCGEGLDDKSTTQDSSTDAVNHLIFWKCS